MTSLGTKLGQIIIPLITPFDESHGDIHRKEVEKLIDHLIEKNQCDSITVAGTTGEFHSLTIQERMDLFKMVKEAVNNRVPLVAGTGATSLRESVALAQEAERLGYETAMVVAPFYCKPTQDGIFRYFESIAKSVSVDIMLYNIPLFTGVNVEPETLARLAELSNVKGIKDEAGVNPTQMTEYARVTPDDFAVYDGDDIMVLCGLAQGAAGVVSGGSHLLGSKMREMIRSFLDGQVEKATGIHNELDPFFKALTMNNRVNPIPILRAALEIAGHAVGPPRLPLCAATPEEREQIKEHLVRLGMI